MENLNSINFSFFKDEKLFSLFPKIKFSTLGIIHRKKEYFPPVQHLISYSDFFEKECEKMIPQNTNMININDAYDEDSFDSVMKLFFGGELSINKNNYRPIYKIAKGIAINSLQQEIVKYLNEADNLNIFSFFKFIIEENLHSEFLARFTTLLQILRCEPIKTINIEELIKLESKEFAKLIELLSAELTNLQDLKLKDLYDLLDSYVTNKIFVNESDKKQFVQHISIDYLSITDNSESGEIFFCNSIYKEKEYTDKKFEILYNLASKMKLEIQELKQENIEIKNELQRLQTPISKSYLIMKLRGKDLHFKAEEWTSGKTYNEYEQSKNLSVITKNYFRKINFLDIVDVSGRTVKLKLPYFASLFELISSQQAYHLEYVEGCTNFYELLTGEEGYKIEPPYFRINAKSTSVNFGARIGGYSTSRWEYNYGVDTLGANCGAEVLGIGVYDDNWSTFNYAYKSYGIRFAHDINDKVAYKNIGQLESECYIYGKI